MVQLPATGRFSGEFSVSSNYCLRRISTSPNSTHQEVDYQTYAPVAGTVFFTISDRVTEQTTTSTLATKLDSSELTLLQQGDNNS